MNNRNIISFSIGMIVGGFIGYYICKKRYHIVKLESVDNELEVSGSPHKLVRDESVMDYDNKVYEASYKKDAKDAEEDWYEAEKVNPIEPEMVPYTISPSAYSDEHSEYAKIVLLYYEENEVLAYEDYNEAEGDDHFADIGSTIGHDALNHFGEYEQDSVFVRNEALGNDYEVILIHGPYDEGE